MTIPEIIRKEIDWNIHQMNRIKRFTQPKVALEQLLFLFIKEKEKIDSIAKFLRKKDNESIYDFDSDFKKKYSDLGYRRYYLKAEKVRQKELDELKAKGLINSIKYYRLKNNWDQETLAEKANTRQSAIARIENLKYNPTRKTLEKYAKIFRVGAKDLL